MSGFQEIPGTNIPRRSSLSDIVRKPALDVPGTTISRKQSAGDVLPSTVTSTSTQTSPTAYTEIPGTNVPRRARIDGVSGETTSRKIMDEVKGVFHKAMGTGESLKKPVADSASSDKK